MFIVLTETWLTDSIHNYEQGLTSYKMCKFYRCNLSSVYLRGIRKEIPSRLITTPILLNVEQLYVKFFLSSNYFYLVVFIILQTPVLVFMMPTLSLLSIP